MQLNSNIVHTFPYQSVSLSSALTELDKEILLILALHQPIMAKHIASQLSINRKSTYSRRDINSRLFKGLSIYVIQDAYFRWSLRHDEVYIGQEEDPEMGQYIEDSNVVTLDSTIRIKDYNGKELMIKFTKDASSKSNGPQADITYTYFKSPLALALMTKKAGDVCYVPGGQCVILEID